MTRNMGVSDGKQNKTSWVGDIYELMICTFVITETEAYQHEHPYVDIWFIGGYRLCYIFYFISTRKSTCFPPKSNFVPYQSKKRIWLHDRYRYVRYVIKLELELLLLELEFQSEKSNKNEFIKMMTSRASNLYKFTFNL